MSYIFYKNWPYYDTVFPTMEDHVDPVNHAYFEGLHAEVENIEKVLGVLPQGAYPDVAQRLEVISPTRYFIASAQDNMDDIDNTEQYVDMQIFGMALSIVEFFLNYDVFVKICGEIVNNTEGKTTYISLWYVAADVENTKIVEIEHTGTTATMVESDWVKLNDVIVSEENFVALQTGFKVDGGIGGVSGFAVVFKYIPK